MFETRITGKHMDHVVLILETVHYPGKNFSLDDSMTLWHVLVLSQYKTHNFKVIFIPTQAI